MYEESGFNEFLVREEVTNRLVALSADQASAQIYGLSGTVIGGGISSSADGKLTINWDTNEVIFSDGARGRVFLGKIAGTDDYGIKIVDEEGNTIMTSGMELQTLGIGDSQISNDKVSGLSASKITTGTLSVIMNVGGSNVLIDGENTRIVINDGTNDRILIGYQSEGF